MELCIFIFLYFVRVMKNSLAPPVRAGVGFVRWNKRVRVNGNRWEMNFILVGRPQPPPPRKKQTWSVGDSSGPGRLPTPSHPSLSPPGENVWIENGAPGWYMNAWMITDLNFGVERETFSSARASVTINLNPQWNSSRIDSSLNYQVGKS